MFQRASNVSDAVPAGSVTSRAIEASRSSAEPDHHCLEPSDGAPSWVPLQPDVTSAADRIVRESNRRGLKAYSRVMPDLQPSASYSFTMRIHHPQRPGAFADVASAIGHSGAILGAIDLVRVEEGSVVRDVTVACVDSEHSERVVAAVRDVPDIVVHSVSDRTFLLHVGGKIEIRSRVPVK